MLRAMRDGAKHGLLKYFLLGLLVLAAGGLVLTDVGGFFRGGVSNNVIAKGKNIEIGTQAFNNNVSRVLSRQGMSPQEAYNMGIINQILNNEIQNLVLADKARDYGLNISDETVMTQISEIADPIAQDGVSKAEALRNFLANQRISEGEFVQAVRQEMANTLYRSALVSSGDSISKQQAADIYRFRNETRDIEAIRITTNDIKDIEQPTDENLQKFYEANKVDFAIPERRDFTMAVLKLSMLKNKIDIAETDLQKFYDDNIEDYTKPKRYKLQQAIFTEQTIAKDVAEKAKESLLEKTVTAVTGDKNAYLGENIFSEKEILDELVDDVINANAGDLIGPIQSALGWHVTKLVETIEPEVQSFDQVKDDIRASLLEEKSEEAYIELGNEIDDRLADGEDLNDLVEEFGLETKSFNGINQAGLNKDNKNLLEEYSRDLSVILENAFDYESGEVSPILELSNGNYAFIQINNIEESGYTPYADVEEKIKTRWINEQKTLSARNKVETILDATKANSSLENLAQENNRTLSKFKNIKRTDTKENLPSTAIQKLFSANINDPILIELPNGSMVAKVTNVSLSDPNEKQISQIQEEVKSLLPQETLGQYINALAIKNKIKINDRVLKELYGSADN